MSRATRTAAACIAACTIAAAGAGELQPAAGCSPAAIAAEAKRVLAASCSRCHMNAEADSFDARSHASLLAQGEFQEGPYVVPGDLEASVLWQYVKDKAASMPKSGDERENFGDDDRAAIRAWILAGAPEFPAEPARKPSTLETMLARIQDYAISVPAKDIHGIRYFTFTHLHNDSKVTAADLRLTRAALAKALNSLSWSQEIVLPEEVPGTEGTVMAVDIARLGWSRDAWNAIARAYPYGLGYSNHDNEKLEDLDGRLRKLYHDREPLIYLRADWFIARATRPPLYHAILYDTVLPELRHRHHDPDRPENPAHMTAADLETYLGVDVIANLSAKKPPVMRAGFPSSGVSGHNRLIERHPLRGQGAYWKSYDFLSSTWEANLQQFPLGPRYEGNPFPKMAFKHDGGEIIFHLPNGLQGYLLVDGHDNRIDIGPIEVVSDPANNSGTPQIVNGISCIACHKNGMRASPADRVRNGKGVYGEARERVRSLYSEKAAIDQAIARDNRLFLDALERTIGPFLRGDEASKTTPITEFPEPVSEVARRYYAARDDLDAETIACELFLDDPALVVAAARSDVFRQLGLGALAVEGGKVKRGAWESLRGTSQMQQAAREFGYSPR